MEQTGKNKTKYTSPHASTWSAKQTADTRAPSDAYWKYAQRSNQDTTDKDVRRHQSPVAEPTASYYSSTNTYKFPKHHSYPCSTYPKRSSAVRTDTPHRYQSTNVKSGRNKDCASNVAAVNKDRYKSQQEDESNARCVDEELGNFTEDNLEDDAEEEADNDQGRTGESFDKEYDEQEADDEIDEESDVPAEPHAMQRNAAKKNALLRAQQRLRTVDQQDPHRMRYHQYPSKLYQAHSLGTRYYHNIPDRDAHEALSEEDLYAAQTLKGPPRRSSAGYHPNWIPQRSSADRYDVTTLPTQPSRRARTRPEMKSFAEAEFADRRKCSRCGNVTTMTKSSTPRRNNYSFQDSPNFATKGHFGDEAEILDQSWCGRCKPKHHLEENMGRYEIPSPAAYATKSRRARDGGAPLRETLLGKCAMDELSREYARMPFRYTKDTGLNVSRDRIRHSGQTTQGPTNRMSVRYDA